MSALVPCSACGRHVQSAEARCPFCGAAMVAPVTAMRSHDGPWPVPAYGGPRPLEPRIPWILLVVGVLAAAALVGALVAVLR